MPCSMVWLRSRRAMRPRAHPVSACKLPREAGQRADAGDRLADLVVRRRGPGGDADDAPVAQPACRHRLFLGADRLVADRSGRGIHAVGVLDVIRAHALDCTSAARWQVLLELYPPDHDHHVERLLEQREHGVLPLLRRGADRVERAEVLGERRRAVAPLHAARGTPPRWRATRPRASSSGWRCPPAPGRARSRTRATPPWRTASASAATSPPCSMKSQTIRASAMLSTTR